MGRGSTAAVSHLIHGNGLNSSLLRHTELLADAGHGVDGVIQLHLQQVLEPGHRFSKLGEELIQRRVEICDAGLMPVIHRDAAPDMDWVLAADEQSRDLGRRDAGVRGEKPDAGRQTRGHGALSLGVQELRIGANKIVLLIRQLPGGACNGMIAVSGVKDITGEAYIQLGLECTEKQVDGENGVI